MTACPHKTTKSGVCQIASRLAGRKVIPWENVCETCTSCDAPQAANYVTASIACHVWTRDDDHETAAALRADFSSRGLFQIGRRVEPKRCGPGCHLHRILESFGVKSTSDCGCTDLSSEMDRRGPQWCRDNLNEIIQKLVNELHSRVTSESGPASEPTDPDEKIPWWIRTGHKIPGASRVVAKRLVLLAIDRAERERAESAN